MQTYIADGFDKRLVCADFSFLERGNAGSNPGDKSKLPPPAHLVPSLKPEICIHSFIVCTEHAYTHEYNKTFTFKESWRLDLRPPSLTSTLVQELLVFDAASSVVY